MTQSGELSSPPARPLNIPLPAGSPPSASPVRTGQRLGILLLILVSGLAFLLASFPARSSDVWLHLARGRLLAHGHYPATTDADLDFDLWGNQTWLYDLCSYACYTLVGGAGLVVAKALLAAGIAVLVLRLSRTGQEWCVPILCTSLAILTIGKHLALQPATVSYFFLALALFLLFRPQTEDEPSPPFISWQLLCLFVVWANTDRWFLLGLGVVGLVWFGELLDAAFSAKTSPKRWQSILLRRGVSLLALIAVCFLNPSFLDAFVLADQLQGVGLSAAKRISPFEGTYFTSVGLNPAGLAYFVLIGLSMLSFLAALSRWRWQRFLPWLGLALLSAYQMRAIPFFAVVAGPVLAWNIRDLLARYSAKKHGAAELAEFLQLGRALTLLVLLILLVSAWLGWLQSPPYGARRWSFDLPPSLERVAHTVRRWHEEGKLPAESGGLHLAPDTLFAFAWFCPEEKRLRLSNDESSPEWQQRMQENKVDHVLVYDPEVDRVSEALLSFISDPQQWPMIYQDGGAAVFGWRDPTRPDSAELFRGWTLDMDRLAFHPAEDKKAPSVSFESQEALPWWHVFWKPVPSRSTYRGEALMHLLHGKALQSQAPAKNLTVWVYSQAAALVAAGGAWASPSALCDAEIRLTVLGLQLSGGAPSGRPSPLDRLAQVLHERFRVQRDDTPPALLYLAVRAARRAVAADPEDAKAYFVLGTSYIGLLEVTRERAWGAQLPQLLKLRQAQASAALNRAIALQPDLPLAHLQLAQLYQSMGYIDLRLKHARIYHRLLREAGPPRGVERETFLAGLARNAKEIEQIAREVEKRESAVTLRTADSPPRDRAIQAFRSGLAGKALELLLESDRSAFGAEGMTLELELLLDVGRAHDVQEWLSPEDEIALTPLSYHWFRVRALAALGDYTRAEEECDETARALARILDSPEPVRLRENLALYVAKLLLDVKLTPDGSRMKLLTQINQVKGGEIIEELIERLRQQADMTALHGLLALEEGEVGEAESAFRAALSLRKGQTRNEASSSWYFNARSLVLDCLRWLE